MTIRRTRYHPSPRLKLLLTPEGKLRASYLGVPVRDGMTHLQCSGICGRLYNDRLLLPPGVRPLDWKNSSNVETQQNPARCRAGHAQRQMKHSILCLTKYFMQQMFG